MGKSSKKKELSHLLVIRLSAMGDVAMTVPVLYALTRQYPELKITVLTRVFFKPMFSQLRNVSIFEADVNGKHKGIHGLWKLFKELKTLKIDGVADLHNVLRSNILKKFFKRDDIPFVQIDKGRKEKKRLISSKNKIFKPLKSTYERYADVFKELGFPLEFKNKEFLTKEALSNKVQKIIEPETKKWIGIAPFAAFEGKMYPLHFMEKVIEKLNNTEKYKILLFGGGGLETEKLNQLSKKYSNVISIAGLLSFEDELLVISNLDVMVAMDSGNGHLSAMYGVPTITLWGVTHPFAGFSPFGQDINNSILADRDKFPFIPTSVYGNKFPKGYEKVMETIQPEQVVQKILQLLN
ncbi:ADP-heptose:LPS heptosyltransferase [Saonia flava]|uniref:ADP-heptose:LPS heptosyltransferase n=1 Tax=Saonia flava TaxID=523696 RepID=A0A846QWB0_9FLAO|nr:glycosyltransferase family 9 protein [Saonia flava]NJB71517.1 ADP-heptose:LPS heptosyltransferase [Saonia flava]